MTSATPTERWIEPHALAFDGFRWHARSWCRRDGAFKDFVLGRILCVMDQARADADPALDTQWQQPVLLEIAPHRGLSPPQRAAIERDYGMEGGAAPDRRRRATWAGPDHRVFQPERWRGQSATAVNLAASFARLRFRVLLVDADPQASATAMVGCDIIELEDRSATLHAVLVDDRPVRDTLIRLRNFDVLPSGLALAEFDSAAGLVGRETRLKAALAERLGDYDFILIDTPPNLGSMTINALNAADHVLIPVVTRPVDLLGIPLLLKTIARVRRFTNHELTVLGVLPTMFAERQTAAPMRLLPENGAGARSAC